MSTDTPAEKPAGTDEMHLTCPACEWTIIDPVPDRRCALCGTSMVIDEPLPPHPFQTRPGVLDAVLRCEWPGCCREADDAVHAAPDSTQARAKEPAGPTMDSQIESVPWGNFGPGHFQVGPSTPSRARLTDLRRETSAGDAPSDRPAAPDAFGEEGWKAYQSLHARLSQAHADLSAAQAALAAKQRHVDDLQYRVRRRDEAITQIQAALAAMTAERDKAEERAEQADRDQRCQHGITLADFCAGWPTVTERAERAERTLAAVRALANEMLGHFSQKGYVGRPCLRSDWLYAETVEHWRAVLGSEQPPAEDGSDE